MNLKRPNSFKPKGFPVAIIVLAALLLVAVGVLLSRSTTASANFGDISNAETQYPGIVGSRIDTCALCHLGSPPNLNPFGSDYLSHGRNTAALVAIQNLDSDGDGFTNLAELTALTFPGDATDHPAQATSTPTAIPTAVPTKTFTATATLVASATSTAVASATATSVVPPTATSEVSPTGTAVPVQGNTNTPSPTHVGKLTRTPKPTKTMGPKPTEGCDDNEDENEGGEQENECTAVPHQTRTPRPTKTMRPFPTTMCTPGGRDGGDDENGGEFKCTPFGEGDGRGEDNGLSAFTFPIRELASIFTSSIFHR